MQGSLHPLVTLPDALAPHPLRRFARECAQQGRRFNRRQPARGRPATADARLGGIPGGRQPFALVRDDPGNVWFTDRKADTVGFLSRARNEVALYRLPPGTHPVFLVLDDAGAVRFIAERGNFVGRLTLVPELGPPPVLPTGAFPLLGYGRSQLGNRASGSVTCRYDGSAGLPVWISTEVLRNGIVVPGFVAPPDADRWGRVGHGRDHRGVPGDHTGDR